MQRNKRENERGDEKSRESKRRTEKSASEGYFSIEEQKETANANTPG